MRAVGKLVSFAVALSVPLCGLMSGTSASSASDFVARSIVEIPRTASQAGAGAVIAWGSGDYGQTRIPVEAQSGVVAISAGVSWVMALSGGRVSAWGDNQYGQTSVPQEALAGVSSISAGKQHGLALKDGRVIAWGDDADGRTAVPGSAQSGVSAIAAGFSHSLALKDGQVIAWGSNYNGETTVPAEAQSGVTAIAAGGGFSLALKDGKVIAWGSNRFGETTIPAEAQSGVTAIAAGRAQSLAITNFGRLIAWGDTPPPPASTQSGVTAAAGGYFHSIALKNGGVIEVGDNLSPPAAAKSGVLAVAAGYGTSYAIVGVSDPPPAPVRVTSSAGDSQATVSWSMPDQASPLVSRYTATASPGGLQCSSSTLDCVITGLTNGTSYTVTVVAINSAGSSPPSAASAPFTPKGSPSAPLNVVVKAGNQEVSVSWQQPNSDGGDAITSYLVLSTPGNRTCSTRGALQCTVVGLTNGTTYTFQVTATNRLGTSMPSVASLAVTPSTTVPGPATNVNGQPGNSEAKVSWQAPISDGGIPITGYTATASPGGQTCSTTGALTCTITGLTNGMAYTFTVTVTNAAGTSVPSDPSAPVTPTAPISVPGVVTNLKATSAKGSIRVSWSPPSNMGGATSVTYQYQVGKQAWKATSATSVTVKGKKGAKITVNVRAVNSAGFGPSVSVSGTPK